MKAIPHRFLYAVSLTAAVGLTASGCYDPGAIEEGEELVDTESQEHTTTRCVWITVQTGVECDGGEEGPPICQPVYGQIQVCQSLMQVCTGHCQYCYSCAPGPGYSTCVNACMNHCMGGCLTYGHP